MNSGQETGPLEFKRIETLEKGVVQYDFDLCVAGEPVPCVLWTPPQHAPRALIAMGHGGSAHKASESMRARAVRYADAFGWATLALDAPGHGERISAEEAERERARTLARVNGEVGAPSLSVDAKIKFLDDLAAQAVPEWQAALDAVLGSGLVAEGIPVAYWGVSQGSSIGIPLLAANNRFKCAVLGLAQLHPAHTRLKMAAQKVTIPLRFAFQWDDPIRERAYGLALFEAFGSRDKSMHINPGGHHVVPASVVASWDDFLASYLEEKIC